GATAPDVTDTRIVLLYLFEVLSDDLADAGRFFGQVFFFHDVNCGKRCGDCHRVPAVGPAETTRMHSVHDLGATGHRRQCHTTGDALGQCDEVGFDPFGFRGEPGAGADETCLNLIGDEYDFVCAAPVHDIGETTVGRDDEATFSLDGLHDDGRQIVGTDLTLQRLNGASRRLVT